MKKTFGEQVQFYRTTHGSHGRDNQKWLGMQLEAPTLKAGTDLISQTQRGKRLLSRRQILRFGALYALKPAELDELLSAAKDQAKQKQKKQEYTPLTPDEIEPPVHGPWDLVRWRDRVRIVVATNIRGNVDSGAPIAQAVLDEIESGLDVASTLDIPWHPDDIAEAHDLWLTAWVEFAFAIEVMVRSEELATLIQPYLRHATMIRDQFTERQVALLDYSHADLMHCLTEFDPKLHQQATWLAQSAMAGLPNTWHRMAGQRVILLDGSEFLSPHHVERNVEDMFRLIESYEDSDYRGLAHGIEGLGQILDRRRDLADRFDITGMDALRMTAKIADQHNYQLGHIMSLRSQMKALANDPAGFDRDQFIEIGERAIEITRQRGWRRKTQQLLALAEQNSVALEK